MIKFKCPKCHKYVKLIGELIPINEDLELYCSDCREETAVLSLRPTQRALDGANAPEKDGPVHIQNIGGGTFVEIDPPRK